MTGEVGILNVGAGDVKVSFDPKNPAERIRAARIVKDMLRRGYALLVKVGDEYRRATDFDENTCEYIIADFDPVEAARADQEEGATTDEQAGAARYEGAVSAAEGPASGPAPKQRRGGRRRVDAASTSSVAVARTAGG